MNITSLLRHIQKFDLDDLKAFTQKPVYAEVELIVIGAQKSGTTALFNYLSAHPNITIPQTKEINYFNSIGRNQAAQREYQKHFPINYGRESPANSIDVSPSYLLDASTVAKKIADLNASSKIAVILREPVSRAISAWFMYKKYAIASPDWFMQADWVRNRPDPDLHIIRRNPNFGESFRDDMLEEIEVLSAGNRIEFPIVEYGLYKRQLEQYFKHLSHGNILILDHAELSHSTQACVDSVTDFMEIPRCTLTEDQLVKHFVGDNKQPIDDKNLKVLNSYYFEQNSGLKELIGRQLSWMLPTNELE